MFRVFIIAIGLLLFNPGLFSQNSPVTKAYIKQYRDLAIKEMKRTGIPASITLAQGILESNSGQSRLAVKGNNHFGIKCHSDWRGRKMKHDDDAKNECFRKYRSVYDSYKDHSDFLVKGQRYAFLFDYKTTDYKSWARGLKKAGYATEKRYAELLIRIIEDYDLHKYDNKKYKREERKTKKEQKKELADRDNFVINPFQAEIKENNRIDYVVVKKGDTFYSISKKHEITLRQIYKYNELTEDSIIKPGQIIYLQPKRNKAEAGNKYHIVTQGETMYSISQKYGIKLKKLYEKNNMKKGEEPEAGTQLSLRRKVRE